MFGGIKGIAVLLVLLAVGAAVTYHFVTVSGLKTTIAERDTAIASLEKDKATLELSNQSLEASNAKKDAINAQVIQQLTAITERDSATQKQLQQAQQALSASKRAKQLDTLRKSKKAELLLNTINKSAACETTNFGRSGSCRNGQWVPR